MEWFCTTLSVVNGPHFVKVKVNLEQKKKNLPRINAIGFWSLAQSTDTRERGSAMPKCNWIRSNLILLNSIERDRNSGIDWQGQNDVDNSN